MSSFDNRSTMGRGTAAGPTMPNQLVGLKLAIPASSMVGRSGSDVERFGADTAIARTVPARICARLPAIRSKMKCRSPCIMSCNAGVVPL